MAKTKRNIKICVECGKTFECPPSDKTVTCSPECRKIHARKRQTGVRRSKETRAKISNAAQGRDMSNLQKSGVEAAMASPKSGRFVTNINAKDWHLISPAGKHYYFHSLNFWLRENGEELFGCKPDSKEYNNVRSGLAGAKRAALGKKYPCCTYKGWQVVPTGGEHKQSSTKERGMRLDLGKYRDSDLECLAKMQREYFNMALSGLSVADIAKRRGCSKQNVYDAISGAIKKIESPAKQKAIKTKNNDLRFRDCDFSSLTRREKEVMEMRISGLQYVEIAAALSITTNCVGKHLDNARRKLNGMGARREEYYNAGGRERAAEYHKKYYRERRESLAEYNKNYYAKNRQRILARAKGKKKDAQSQSRDGETA